MAEGQGTGLRVLTGEGHDLGESLGREGGGGAGAGLIGEDRLDEAEQLGVAGAFGLSRFEAVSGLGPTLAPGTGGLPMKMQLMSDRIVGQAIGGKADDLEATEQLLRRVLPTRQMVEELALALGKLDGKWARAGHPMTSYRKVRREDRALRAPVYPIQLLTADFRRDVLASP
jgi:hypothetical protein